jgi:hypothetical protein
MRATEERCVGATAAVEVVTSPAAGLDGLGTSSPCLGTSTVGSVDNARGNAPKVQPDRLGTTRNATTRIGRDRKGPVLVTDNVSYVNLGAW